MQPDPLTLSVDAANNGTPANEDYDRHLEEPNRSTYVGATHTEASREMLQLYRTAPRRSGESRGVAKCSAKFTQDISVPNASGSGDIVIPLIGEVSFAVPLGATAAETKHLRQRIVSFLDTDTISAKLVDDLSI